MERRALLSMAGAAVLGALAPRRLFAADAAAGIDHHLITAAVAWWSKKETPLVVLPAACSIC